MALWSISRRSAAVPDQTALEGVRADYLEQAIAGLRHGLPLLVGWSEGKPGLTGWTYGPRTPIAISDDVGLYIFGGVLGWATGETDPHIVVKWIYVGCMAAVVLIAPLVYQALFRSLVPAIVAPLLLIYSFTVLDNTETSWLGAWTTLFAVPLIALVALRPWTRWSVAFLIGLSVLASALSAIRVQTGLPVLLGAAGVALFKSPRWRSRVLVVACLVLGYLSIYPIGLQPVFQARDRSLHHPVTATFPTYHIPWHNAYIGLGYIKNPYGIYWLDDVGFERAAEMDPGVIPNSRRYAADVRKLYFDTVRDHPGFALRGYAVKSRLLLATAFDRWKLALVLLPLAFAFGRHRRTFRLLAALALPGLLLTFLPPVLTIPSPQYAAGFYGTVGFYWLLSVVWLALFVVEVALPAAWRFGRYDDRRSVASVVAAVRARPRAAIAPVVALLGLLIVALYRPSDSALAVVVPERPTKELSSSETPAQSSNPNPGSTVSSWSFAGALPRGWTAVADATVKPSADTIEVTTGDGRGSYALQGPTLILDTGEYREVIDGSVRDGGLTVGVLDVGSDKWIAFTLYSAKQNFAGRRMVTSFRLDGKRRVRILLANWRSEDKPSRWHLRSAAVEHAAP